MTFLYFLHSGDVCSLGWESVELDLQAWDASWLEFAHPASSCSLSLFLVLHFDSDVPFCVFFLCFLGVRCTDLKSGRTLAIIFDLFLCTWE